MNMSFPSKCYSQQLSITTLDQYNVFVSHLFVEMKQLRRNNSYASTIDTYQ
jgi:hypothetical protein